jgi:hypothetical protein
MQMSAILWFTFMIMTTPSYYLIVKGFKLQGQALNQLLADTAKVGFLYCFSAALSWFYLSL